LLLRPVLLRRLRRLPARLRLPGVMLLAGASMRPPATARAPADAGTDPGPRPAVLELLVANRERFLRFLERRVGRRELAEEILHDAYVRGMDASGGLRDDESAIAWFYRLLRNALVDHHRRAGAEQRALAAVARQSAAADPPADPELLGTVCDCADALVATLKPEYAEAVRAVDLGGGTVQQLAARAGITGNNAAVRLHRARQALRRRLEQVCGACAQHGCLDCACWQRARGA
jgi:RNA polymerase sigma-70 factor (ECF subfamily)